MLADGADVHLAGSRDPAGNVSRERAEADGVVLADGKAAHVAPVLASRAGARTAPLEAGIARELVQVERLARAARVVFEVLGVGHARATPHGRAGNVRLGLLEVAAALRQALGVLLARREEAGLADLLRKGHERRGLAVGRRLSAPAVVVATCTRSAERAAGVLDLGVVDGNPRAVDVSLGYLDALDGDVALQARVVRVLDGGVSAGARPAHDAVSVKNQTDGSPSVCVSVVC